MVPPGVCQHWPMTSGQPMWIEVTRGGRVESRHRIDAAVCTSAGELVDSHGDPARPTLPRSASKPIQALPLVLSGAADAFGFSAAELALACASHSGEPGHVEVVLAALGRAGSGPHELECGAHRPSHEPAADALVRAGLEPGPEHNNCSGKHTGFLVTAHHLGEDPAGYIAPDHPVQRRVTAAMSDLCEHTFDGQEPGVDGCGIPVWAVPLTALARGWARLADPARLGTDLGAAATRLLDAMVAEPWFVAGTGRTCTHLMEHNGPRVAAKGGAEGVYCAVDREQAIGIALKCADGSRRGSELAVATIIARTLGEPDPDPVPVRNVAGRVVGEVRVV